MHWNHSSLLIGGRHCQHHYLEQPSVLCYHGPRWRGWQATARPEEASEGREVILPYAWRASREGNPEYLHSW